MVGKLNKPKIEVEYTNRLGQEYILEFVNGYGNSSCIDVALAEDLEIGYGEFKKVSLGFCLAIPEGYKAIIKPRSSTFSKYGLIQTNSPSEIDPTYSGYDDVWNLPLFRPITDKVLLSILAGDKSILDEKIKIPKGTRIAQMEIVRAMENMKFVLLDNETYKNKYNKSRGGFGSTGN